MTTPMFTSIQVAETIDLSKTIALRLGHPTLGVEHVMLGLLQTPYVQKAMMFCKVDPTILYEQIYQRAQRENVNTHPTAIADRLPLDLSLTEVLNWAANNARSVGRHRLDLGDLLVSVVHHTPPGWLRMILAQHRLDNHAVIQAMETMAVQANAQKLAVGPEVESGATVEAPAKKDLGDLEKYAVCLNDLAAQGKLDPIVGRATELDRVIQTLARRSKNNPLLVGDPGVGKSAIADALAQRIVAGTVPEHLREVQLYSLSMAALVAGTKYRGDFEARVQSLIDVARREPSIVLVVDEIHSMVGAGGAGGMDAANLMKPALANGVLRVIGATTYEEYRQVFSKDRALNRRFQKIEVNEPSQDETLDILRGVRANLERHHGVHYTHAALAHALTLAVRHLPDRLLPDKAIDVLDEAGAAAHLKGAPTVDEALIEKVVAQMARVPVGQVSASDRDRVRQLESHLRAAIFGQNEAITTLVKAIKLAHAGIRQGSRPVANLLFAGPTGVGKTELTQQLAQQLQVPLLRFDMSEYMEAHSVSRLIGAPPGYVGHEGGGLLTEAVAKSPHAVVLLDEIEKAHPSINQILLQVMDRGCLTDTHGREVDFRHVVLVLTTNAGAAQASRRTLGFVAQDHNSDASETIRASFAPEFRNRLDAIVNFKSLGAPELLRVVDKFIQELAHTLEEKGVALTVSDRARQWLAEHGHDATMGARPMRRLIEDTLQVPLADALLFGGLDTGGQAVFDLDEDDAHPGPVLTATPVGSTVSELEPA